ncbi:MAG: hypothetical protein AB7N91_28095 [Candidatus Tectimicrobiota bacterium]
MKPRPFCCWSLGGLCLLSLLLYAALSLAQTPPQPVRLTGQVRGIYSDPKPFVSVQFDGPERYIALTSSRGEFTLETVIPGQYRIMVKQGNNVQIFSLAVRTSPLMLTVKW